MSTNAAAGTQAAEQITLEPRTTRFLMDRRYVTAALMLVMVLASMEQTITSTAMPTIIGDLHGFEHYSWVVSIYLLALTVSMPLYGRLADVWGRKRVILGAVLIFSIGSALETSTAGVSNIMQTCIALAEDRRASPRDDLLTALVQAEIDGVPLNPTQIGFNALMFFAAGHETTRSSMSVGLLELLNQPKQFAWLKERRDDPVALRAAIEEFVRYSSPLTHTLRTVTEDVEVGGKQFREGDWAVIWFHGANRDEKAFAEPERFDVRRSPNPHLGFAVGKHFCLGAHLARLDMVVMLQALIDQLDGIELDGPVEWSSSNLFWGIKHMPIRFRARDGLRPELAAQLSS